jgi:hypothetical protein
MKEYLPFLASVLSGLLVFLLGHWINKKGRQKSDAATVEIREIDDRAKLTEELWAEVRSSRVEKVQLYNELLEERRKNLKLEMINERLTARIREAEEKLRENKLADQKESRS